MGERVLIGANLKGMPNIWERIVNSVKRYMLLGRVALASFALSLSIEHLQLLLHVGFFEVTDLVMNTLGGFAGALISVELRKEVGWMVRQISPLAGARSK